VGLQARLVAVGQSFDYARQPDWRRIVRRCGPREGSVVTYPAEPRLSAHPTANGALTRLAFARAETAGLDVDRMLRQAHLTRQQIEDPAVRLRVGDQISFLNLVADALKDDLLGFHLARVADLREIGWLYYVASSSENLGEALQRGARYSSIANEGVSLGYTDNKEVSMEIRYVGVSRHLDRHQIEFIAAILVRMCRQLSGLQIVPSHVQFVHSRTNPNSELFDLFGGNVEFGATIDQVAFPASVKAVPLVDADPYLNRLLTSYCEAALADRGAYRGSFRSSVENTIIPLLPHGKAQAEEIARRLGVSRRTFARRLADEGATFSEVLENMRFELAKRHLADRDLSVSEIAWLLGYHEISAFTHAFKRWTGSTPRDARSRTDVLQAG
jgi:AraC-like DNA-binding protein